MENFLDRQFLWSQHLIDNFYSYESTTYIEQEITGQIIFVKDTRFFFNQEVLEFLLKARTKRNPRPVLVSLIGQDVQRLKSYVTKGNIIKLRKFLVRPCEPKLYSCCNPFTLRSHSTTEIELIPTDSNNYPLIEE